MRAASCSNRIAFQATPWPVLTSLTSTAGAMPLQRTGRQPREQVSPRQELETLAAAVDRCSSAGSWTPQRTTWNSCATAPEIPVEVLAQSLAEGHFTIDGQPVPGSQSFYIVQCRVVWSNTTVSNGVLEQTIHLAPAPTSECGGSANKLSTTVWKSQDSGSAGASSCRRGRSVHARSG